MSRRPDAAEVATRLGALSSSSDAGVTRSVQVLTPEPGVLAYEVAPETETSTGVIFCPSFFELKTLQSSELALAEDLARAGFYALYVQAPGTGESFGDPEEVRIATRVATAVAAGRRALSEGRCARVVFFGARLGGAVAIQAAQQFDQASFAAWDPVLEGSVYLKQARRLDRIAAMAGRRKGYEGLEEQLERRGWATVLGNVVTRDIYDDLISMSVSGGLPIPAPCLSVCLDDQSARGVCATLATVSPSLSVRSLGRKHLGHLGFTPEDAAASIPLTLAWLKGSLPT